MNKGFEIAATIGASVGLAIGVLKLWPVTIMFLTIGAAITVLLLKSTSLLILMLVLIVQLLAMSLIIYLFVTLGRRRMRF